MWFTLENMQGCENLPSLPEQGGGSSAERCSDGEQSVPSKLRSTREASSCNAKKTGSSTASRSGTTCAPSTASRGAERSISSAEVSRARTSAAQGEGSALSAESGADCGESMHGSFARFDRATASWKTAQCLLLGGLESFSGTWPRSGMMRRGRCYPPAIVAHRMNGRGCGLSEKIPTPCSHDSFDMYLKDSSTSKFDSARLGLAAFVRKYPTPVASYYKSVKGSLRDKLSYAIERGETKTRKYPTPCRTDYKGAGKTGTFRDRLDYAVERGRTKSNVYPTPCSTGKGGSHAAKKMKDILGQGNGGRLNPDWVEWLMGWPIGWTALKPMEMVKFQSWLSGRFVI